mmetsp:Transcript_23532/g.53090  ORF Transcript_23532/g.53090 Transcript_23532/m.53090 type:complete len:242 (-) Transcript_23532:187-912(-)
MENKHTHIYVVTMGSQSRREWGGRGAFDEKRRSISGGCLVAPPSPVSNARDEHGGVVDDLLLPQPPGLGLLDQRVHGLLARGGPRHQVRHLLGGHELPQAVRGRDQKQVLAFHQCKLKNLGFGRDPCGVRDFVAETPAHGEAGNVRVGEPHTRRAVDTVVIVNRKHATPGGLNTSLLKGGIGLVVLAHVFGHDGPALPHAHDQTAVPDVGAPKHILTNDSGNESSSTELVLVAQPTLIVRF